MAHLTFDDGFYHADRARDIAIGNGSANTNVLKEINALQEAVDEATKSGLMILDSEDEGVSSPMTTGGTTPTIYYKVWSDKVGSLQNAANALEESEIMAADVEMNRVIAYFSRRGYLITRDRFSTLVDRIKWIIKW